MDILNTVILATSLISCFLLLFLIIFVILIYRDISKLQEVSPRLFQLFHMLNALTNTVNLQGVETLMSAGSGGGRSPRIWRSGDGRHTANSMEELLEKMAQDSTYTEKDLDNLRDQLEKMGDHPELDDEDDDEPKWKKK